eukprot:1142481-Pelagomonas_calceolata.AAC.2
MHWGELGEIRCFTILGAKHVLRGFMHLRKLGKEKERKGKGRKEKKRKGKGREGKGDPSTSAYGGLPYGGPMDALWRPAALWIGCPMEASCLWRQLSSTKECL